MPKGLIESGEDPFEAALREFEEETGIASPMDPDALESNSFTIEWPPNAGGERAFPELDRAAYFDLATAAEKIVEGQRPLPDRLRAAVRDGRSEELW